MSESTLSKLKNKIESGLKNMNEEAKAKAKGEKYVEPDGIDHQDNQPNSDEGFVAEDEPFRAGPASKTEFDEFEPVIIDARPEPETKKSGLSALSFKQKFLMLAGAAGFVFLASNIMSSVDQQDLPNTQGQELAQDQSNTATKIDEELPFGFGSDMDDAGSVMAEPGYDDSGNPSGFSGSDDPNTLLGDNLDIEALNQEEQLLGDGNSTEMLDPFTREVLPADELVIMSPDKPTTADQVPSDFDVGDDLQTSLESPFDSTLSNSTELSGGKSKNPDSGSGELVDRNANANVGDLMAEIADKDTKISDLEQKLAATKQDLDAITQQLAKAQESSVSREGSAQRTAPVANPNPTRRATVRQNVAIASERPKVCVTAVAQAARNCTTCVPHAFITHDGVESMVGQGDYIEGLRVSITGDRLDLQNAQGEVAHKFWSSPNGCTAKTSS
tara:strand:+ start:17484 stop:18815 length:1332 start_codon:yes stop_codon:yes gene_type:complete